MSSLEKKDLESLPPEEKIRYKKSRRRIMVLLVVTNIALCAYLIYEIITLFAKK